MYRKNRKLRKGYTFHEYTDIEKVEYVKCYKDIAYFIRNYVEDINQETEDALYAMCGDGKMVLNFNEDLIEAQLFYILHYMLFSFDKNISIHWDTPFLREQVKFNIKYWFENLPRFLQVGVVMYKKDCIRLDNGCMLVFAKNNQSAGIGHSFELVFVINEHDFNENMIMHFRRYLYPTTLCRQDARVMLYTFRRVCQHNAIILT